MKLFKLDVWNGKVRLYSFQSEEFCALWYFAKWGFVPLSSYSRDRLADDGQIIDKKLSVLPNDHGEKLLFHPFNRPLK